MSRLYEAPTWEVHLGGEFSFLLEFLVLAEYFLLFCVGCSGLVGPFHSLPSTQRYKLLLGLRQYLLDCSPYFYDITVLYIQKYFGDYSWCSWGSSLFFKKNGCLNQYFRSDKTLHFISFIC